MALYEYGPGESSGGGVPYRCGAVMTGPGTGALPRRLGNSTVIRQVMLCAGSCVRVIEGNSERTEIWGATIYSELPLPPERTLALVGGSRGSSSEGSWGAGVGADRGVGVYRDGPPDASRPGNMVAVFLSPMPVNAASSVGY